MTYNRDDILNDLRNHTIEVTFTKANGQQRVMRCTLQPRLLPASYVSEASEEKEYHNSNPDVIAAWDVQNNGWRSFRISAVEYVQLIDGY